MGVRGLTTYINNNQHAFLQDFSLHDCSLIIDGHSLCAQLYRLLNCFSAFGGDYDKFANYVRNFFKSLRKCNITSYVLFDGSYERRKLKTAYSRLRSKIYGASKLDPVTQSSLQIFPLLLRDVFVEALIDMKILYTVCEFEADDEIAAMARHLNCPVLSYDSDFFIYNVLYIPFNTLDLKLKPLDIDGIKTFVIQCKIYRVEHMISNFGGLQEELLPLLATLLGNDFVKKRVFNKFFSHLKLPKTKRKSNDQQRCIHGLFQWLQNESLDSAIAKILGRLKKKQKDKVLYIIKRSIDGYNSKQCRSLKYFNISEDDTPQSDWQPPDNIVEQIQLLTNEESGNEKIKSDESSSENEENSSENEDNSSENEENSTENEENIEHDDKSEIEADQLVLGLPEWVANNIRQNIIPKNLINLYTHHLHFCSPQAEDYNDADSFLSCLPILRCAFDLLTDFANEHCVYVSRENETSYRRFFIGREVSITRPYDIPFNELTEEQMKFCFHHFLKEKMPSFNVTVIADLPPNFQLYFIALLWWIVHCDVSLGNVHSLFMSYIMLDAIDEKIGTFRGHYLFNNKFNKKLQELRTNQSSVMYDKDELFLNKNKIRYEDSLIAASVLLKHFELDDKIQKRPKSYDIKKMHSFAQFQCCLMQFNCLNTLCRSPFQPTKYSKCYNGTFIYNLAVKLEHQMDPMSFFEQYLKGANTVLMFYKSICTIYDKCVLEMNLSTYKWTAKERKEKKNQCRRRKINVEEEEINFIVKGFESEVII